MARTKAARSSHLVSPFPKFREEPNIAITRLDPNPALNIGWNLQRRRLVQSMPPSFRPDSVSRRTMIEPEIIVVPAVFAITAVILIVRMSFKHREKMASITGVPSVNPVAEQRLARIEEALESIAIE